MLSTISGGCKAREDFFDRVAWLIMAHWILDFVLTLFTFPTVLERAFQKHIALQFSNLEFYIGVIFVTCFALKEYQVQREIGHAQPNIAASIFHMSCALPLLMTVISSLTQWRERNETHRRIRSVATVMWQMALCVIHPLYIGVLLPAEEALEISPIPLVMLTGWGIVFMYISSTRKTVLAALTFMIFQPYLNQDIDTQNMQLDIIYRLPIFWSRVIFSFGTFFASMSTHFVYEQRNRWAFMTRNYFEWTSTTSERYPNHCFFNLVIPCTHLGDDVASLQNSVSEFFMGHMDSVEGLRWKTRRDSVSVYGFVNRETYRYITERIKTPGDSVLPMSDGWVSFLSHRNGFVETFVVECGIAHKNPMKYVEPHSNWIMLLLFFSVAVFDVFVMGWFVRETK